MNKEIDVIELKKAIKNKDLTDIPFEHVVEIINNSTEYSMTFGEMMYIIDIFTNISNNINNTVISTQTDAKKINEQLSKLNRKVDSINSRINELEERFDRIGMIFSGDE